VARSHGSGAFEGSQFARLGRGVVFEAGVLVFHPENIELGDDVYVGHYAILKGYHENRIRIGDGTWIGQQCFLHGAGGLEIGRYVGIGPGVRILTSSHRLDDPARPILHAALELAPVYIGEGADLGASAVVLPGARIGEGAQVGAGSVVTGELPPFAVAAGSPARVLRLRK
jgi:acetyltransferase-like isoleucine patch superfamily enzyme